MLPTVNCLGTDSIDVIAFKVVVIIFDTAYPPYLMCSLVKPSGPGDFPFGISAVILLTSSTVKESSKAS